MADEVFAQQILGDPRLTLDSLTIVAQRHPGLRIAVAMHPLASPELLDWLDAQGDAMVQAAVAQRRTAGVTWQPPPLTVFGVPLRRPEARGNPSRT